MGYGIWVNIQSSLAGFKLFLCLEPPKELAGYYRLSLSGQRACLCCVKACHPFYNSVRKIPLHSGKNAINCVFQKC